MVVVVVVVNFIAGVWYYPLQYYNHVDAAYSGNLQMQVCFLIIDDNESDR